MGSEIEIDNTLYVSVDFLLQYPEYLDEKLDEEAGDFDMDVNDGAAGPEEGDDSPSDVRSEMTINGVPYIAVPMLKQNPNYVELKYKHKQDVELPTFVPANVLEGHSLAASRRRRRGS
ncbi:MAG: hypothetical protein AAGF11_24765 [Myxococcota bacterium]